MRKTILYGLIGLAGMLIACNKQIQKNEANQDEVFMFSYFMGNGEDGLHLAFSEDGYRWTALNNNQSFLTPEVGNDKLMRDPCVITGPDGKFHMVWTVSWNEKGIGYASSDDLMHWSEQQYIPVMEHEPTARNCWAPEVFYDQAQDQYMIYWATTIPDRFPETDSSSESKYNHRMYCVTTKDFTAFSDTRLLYDQGFNVIDATIQKTDTAYVMFLKNETLYPEEKNIRIATSQSLTEGYGKPSPAITKNWVEGPTVLKKDNHWMVYFDRYRDHEMGAVVSEDLITWTDISDKVHFPEGTRHGTVFRASKAILEAIQQTHISKN